MWSPSALSLSTSPYGCYWRRIQLTGTEAIIASSPLSRLSTSLPNCLENVTVDHIRLGLVEVSTFCRFKLQGGTVTFSRQFGKDVLKGDDATIAVIGTLRPNKKQCSSCYNSMLSFANQVRSHPLLFLRDAGSWQCLLSRRWALYQPSTS